MAEFFEFSDLVGDFEVLPIARIIPGRKDQFTTDGKLIKYPETEEPIRGVLVPFSNYQLREENNGNYTEKDRQLFSLYPLNLGDFVEQDGQRFKIDRLSPYDQWTDVHIYFCKGWDKPKAGGPQNG